MIRGVIFDLGSTLIYNRLDINWPRALDRMRGELLTQLTAAGYQIDVAAFLARFAAKVNEYSDQRQTDWVEYTTHWILASTLEEMNLPAPPPELARVALAAYYAYSETLWQPVPGLHETL